MIKRALILYAEAGHGHTVSAYAVKQAFKKLYPDIVVEVVDVIDYADPVYRKLFVQGYNFVSARGPSVWGFLYKFHEAKPQQKLFQFVSKLALESKLLPYIKEFNPDVISPRIFYQPR